MSLSATRTNNDVITISKTAFLQLKRQADAYQKIAAKLFELPLRDPIHEVVADFRDSNLYAEGFLNDLEDGLRKSSYAKRYGHRTSSK